MSDMKLIMEGWRSYSQDKKENTIFLLEHNRPYKVNFDLILEQKRLDESIKLWEESSNYELEKLLSEIDLMGKAKELTSKIGMKINEFIFKMSMQAYKLIQKGAKAAKRVASIVSKLTNAISKYCSKLPIVCKVAKISAMVIVLLAISALLYSPEAQAAIQIGEKPFDSDIYNTLRGMIMDVVKDSGAHEADMMKEIIDTVDQLDKIQASPDITHYEELSDPLKKALDLTSDMYIDIANKVEQDPSLAAEADEAITWFRKLGETAKAAIDITIERSPGSIEKKVRLSFDSDAGPRPW
jgi:hypothetical protein